MSSLFLFWCLALITMIRIQDGFASFNPIKHKFLSIIIY